METVQRDYAPKGVKFYYIYKALAHPEQNGYVTPLTQKERLMHVAEAKKQLGTKFQWICDTMDNELKHALGDAPNSEFIVDPQGKIVKSRSWSDPDQLRRDLAELVGEVTPATTVADIGMKPLSPPETAARGVVPRVELPGRMSAVVVKAVDDGSQPYYVKLRAEVDESFNRSGEGKLYLGFFLDPLYKVHWNNKVAPLQYEIEAGGSVEVSPAKGRGPEVEQAADADPREFLLEAKADANAKFRVKVKYFACDDAATFCKPVTQVYEVTLTRDRDGGSRRSFGSRGPRGPGAGRPQAGRPRPQRGNREAMARQMFRRFDRNGDGKLQKDELPPGNRFLPRADANGDGVITLEELLKRARR